jgi:hypothetical protein
MDQGRSVGMATCYGLEGAEIEPRWRRGLSDTSRPILGPTDPPATIDIGFISRGYNGLGMELATKPI